MNFWIQTSQPKTVRCTRFLETDSLHEAAQAAFPLEAEEALIVWGGTRIPVCYKYDVGLILEDIHPAIRSLFARPSGVEDGSFGSNTFSGTWHLSWDANRLSFSVHWRSAIGIPEAHLNETPTIQMSRGEFLGEWGALARRFLVGVHEAGVLLLGEIAADYQRLLVAFPASRLYGPTHETEE